MRPRPCSADTWPCAGGGSDLLRAGHALSRPREALYMSHFSAVFHLVHPSGLSHPSWARRGQGAACGSESEARHLTAGRRAGPRSGRPAAAPVLANVLLAMRDSRMSVTGTDLKLVATCE